MVGQTWRPSQLETLDEMQINFPGWNGRPVEVDFYNLPDDGDLQTAATIQLMRGYAAAGAVTDVVRGVAGSLSGSGEEFARSVWWFVRNHVHFERDSDLAQGVEGWGPELVEVLIPPDDLLTMQPARGDCDDFSMLVAALLLARGVRCSFATVAADPIDPSRYSHVYVVAHFPAGDFAIDASHGPAFGWEAPNRFGKRRLWEVKSGMVGLAGLVGVAENTPDFTVTTTERVSVPWWQTAIFEGIDIARDRLLPENSFRVDAGGVVSRGSSSASAVVPVTDVRATVGGASLLGGSSTWIALIVALFFFLLLMSKGKR